MLCFPKAPQVLLPSRISSFAVLGSLKRAYSYFGSVVLVDCLFPVIARVCSSLFRALDLELGSWM